MGTVAVEQIELEVARVVDGASTVTPYGRPLVAVASADDPAFLRLRDEVDGGHALPEELLQGAVSVVSFFIPFDGSVVRANARERDAVAREWAVAYMETNALIASVAGRLCEILEERGARAVSPPATGQFDRRRLTSRWSHKSVAVVSGLGSFGLHRMVITDVGCAGRLGSLVTDEELTPTAAASVERCAHFRDGSCSACVAACPVGALSIAGKLDRMSCWRRCRANAIGFEDLGRADVCGKCAVGPCALSSF